MEIKVNNCNNCPFFYSDYDDFAVRDSTLDICNLKHFIGDEDYMLKSHNGEFVHDGRRGTCPLNKEDFKIERDENT